MRRKLLPLALALALLPRAAAADGLTLEQLQAKFPDGKYWNHPAGTPSSQNGWTDTPCAPHSQHDHRRFNGACGCNCFSGLTIQCEGFAFQLQEDAFGAGFGVSSYHHPRAVWDYTAAMEALKPGDVVRYHTGVWNHSIFITAVDGERIVYADCNAENTCQIRWDVEGTKSMLAEGFRYMDPGAWALAPAAAAGASDRTAVPAVPLEVSGAAPEGAADPGGAFEPSGAADTDQLHELSGTAEGSGSLALSSPSEPSALDGSPGSASLTLRFGSISVQSKQAPAVSIDLLPPGMEPLGLGLHPLAVCTVTLDDHSIGAASLAVPDLTDGDTAAALRVAVSPDGAADVSPLK